MKELIKKRHLIPIAVWFVIFGILWKRMNDKYGTPNSHKKK